jgi:hypothetical protein
MSPTFPLVLSPALPSELLTYILDHHLHPTTLIVCSTRTDFLHNLAKEVHKQATPPIPSPEGSPSAPAELDEAQPGPRRIQPNQEERQSQSHRLLSSPLYQVAVSRHVRIVYVPTATHLRAYLLAFSPGNSKVPAPPEGFSPTGRQGPHLVVYGVIEQHRDTSEWSAQGLGTTAAALVETAEQLGWQLVLIEPPNLLDEDEDASDGVDRFADLLAERTPMLSGGSRKAGLGSDGGGWSGRTVEIGRVMSRWFRFQRGAWDERVEINQEGI